MKRLGGKSNAYYKVKRHQSEKATYLLCDSQYVTFWKTRSYGDGKHISGCSGLVDRRRVESAKVLHAVP